MSFIIQLHIPQLHLGPTVLGQLLGQHEPRFPAPTSILGDNMLVHLLDVVVRPLDAAPPPLVIKRLRPPALDAIDNVVANDGQKLETVAAAGGGEEQAPPAGVVVDEEVARRRVGVPADALGGKGAVVQLRQGHGGAQDAAQVGLGLGGDAQGRVVDGGGGGGGRARVDVAVAVARDLELAAGGRDDEEAGREVQHDGQVAQRGGLGGRDVDVREHLARGHGLAGEVDEGAGPGARRHDDEGREQRARVGEPRPRDAVAAAQERRGRAVDEAHAARRLYACEQPLHAAAGVGPA
ncbi:hypothetical protein BN1723_014737 [Verticillium longisporum]|uniref:Uncharacterized protein n=1 Tax=Verticillium longisporum TaxID=100787 RepID=A0A0G4MHL4_VERLO|nr:hypothetical protein BN1723_014737 [Verticillium longisporum]